MPSACAEIGVKTARSRACHSLAEGARGGARDRLPVMLRGGYALGGKGSGIVETEGELDAALRRAFAGGMPQVLVEECLRGWKEIEYEVVRDARDNCITVCNMENFDPMGIHTGESIVVAPSQTLNDDEYQLLRTHRDQDGAPPRHRRRVQHPVRARPASRRLPRDRGQRAPVALARRSPARPPAIRSRYVAAKIALGYALPEIANAITRRTTAFFEPALDYLVCKVPRWDLGKFQGASMRIGSEMKSVGEVMAIGRTFPEVIQKALRMLDIGVRGLDPDAFRFDDVRRPAAERDAVPHLRHRPGARDGMSVDEIHELTRDRPLVPERHGARRRHARSRSRRRACPLDASVLREAKQLGFSRLARSAA